MKSKRRGFNQTIDIPIYNSEIQVYFTANIRAAYKRVSIEHPTMGRLDGTADALFSKIGTGLYLIFLGIDPTPEEIAHESLHATNQILYDHGVIYSIENDEPYAYVLGHIVKEIHKMRDENI